MTAKDKAVTSLEAKIADLDKKMMLEIQALK
jgi:hypothetical protein